MASLNPKDYKSQLVRLFFQAFIQVYLVCLNTYFISKGIIIGIAIASYLISYVWSLNVKKISTSTTFERNVYAAGASVGGVLGYLTGQIIS